MRCKFVDKFQTTGMILDFVGLPCQFAFLSGCPDLDSEGKKGNWYLVSRARWLLISPALTTYLPIAFAPFLVYFFQSSRAYCCQDGDRKVSAVRLLLVVWFDVAGAGGAAHIQHDTISAAFFSAHQAPPCGDVRRYQGQWFMVQWRHF